MGVSSTQVGDHWGSARTVQPITFLGESGDSGAKYCGVLGRICGVVVVLTTHYYYYCHRLPVTFSTRSMKNEATPSARKTRPKSYYGSLVSQAQVEQGSL